MDTVRAPDDALEQLCGQRLLAALDGDAVTAVANRLTWRTYPGAEHVLHAGDPADGLGFVVSGRLRAMVDGEIIGEIGQGEPVGETGPLTGRPRNADVVTVRDSLVAWLALPDFEAVVAEHPAVALELARHALRRNASELRGRGIPATVAVLSASPSLDSRSVCQQLAEHSNGVRPIDVLATDLDRDAAARTLASNDRQGHQTLLPVGLDDDAVWRLRQADRVWVLVDAADPAAYRPASLAPVTAILQQISASGVTPATELVLIHPPTADLPQRTRVLLDQLDVIGHHHVRSGDDKHRARLVRHLQGRSVNLVLSGGGARGHAHLGVHRVLVDAGCPVDTVAGTSFGALIAAQIADGEPTDSLIQRNQSWTSAKVGSSFSYPPVISLMSIRRALRVFDELFGDRDLEDLWLPCFVAAVDLSDGTLRIIERGPIAAMVRASGSPPGLWPPVPDDRGHLLVDGALVDNLPVFARRALTPGPVIAVDVSKTDDMTVDPNTGSVTSLRDFLRSSRAKSPFPTLPKLLTRAMTLAGAARLREALELSDLVIQPNVASITLPEHRRAPEATRAGDEAAREALAQRPGLIESWR